MPRRTRRQLVGKQEEVDRQEREEALRVLAWELHVDWFIGGKDFQADEVELTQQAVALLQAKTMLLTVPMRTM
jgi:hypothetical protein